MISNYGEMELKWQKRWADKGLFRAIRDEKKPKFMVIFAYPGVTGYLHVGHMRGFSYADAIGRYKRMTGYNVLFPVGTHATGNGSISLAAKIEKGNEDMIDYLKRNGCPEEKIKDLTKPMNVVDFFNDVYVNEYWKRFGFLADWRRFTCTLYPDYAKFIQWQFRKLKENGLLIQKPYYAPSCIVHGPVAVDASETDISKGGNAETQEYVLLKFKHGDEYLVAATLRPETIYGQVCFWVNPDVEYVRMTYNGEKWIVSPQAFEKLQYQKDGVEKTGVIAGKDMIGWMCTAPALHKEIPVFPATFCDPNVGTGLVTSCPSDAPDDWISLEEVKKNPELKEKYGLSQELIDSVVPISIIEIKGYGEFPAQSIIQSMGIERPGDSKLVDAKKQVYKDGYHMGKMKANCDLIAGMRVEEAKDRMKEIMVAAREADIFYDLTEEVICRCGSKVLIKRIDDQWFINYADKDLTERTKEHCKSMHIEPTEYYNNVQGVLDWFRERACARLGNWLGTKFPYDEKWIIEAISDSTLYPIYYLISLYANEGRIKPDQMVPEFFDYAFLGEGDVEAVSKTTGIDVPTLKEIRDDVKYWYPLDLNLGGKEHMTVHFPAFLFNHTGILPQNMWPRGIMVNWYVTGKKKINTANNKLEGTKISKSKGGAQPIPGAVEKLGVDPMRLFYAHAASPFADVEWDEENVFSYKQRVEKILSFMDELMAMKDGKKSDVDDWLLSRMNTHIAEIEEAMDSFDIRQLASTVYFEMFNDFKWYVRRGGNDPETIRKAARLWIMTMMPITPHIAEEMWEGFGFEGMVAEAQLPEVDHTSRSSVTEYGEDFIRDVMADIQEIIKVTGMEPKRIVLYTPSEWKLQVYRKALALHKEGKLDIPTLTKNCMADETLRTKGKAVSDLARKVAQDYMRLSVDKLESVLGIDETEHLSAAAKFMSDEIGYPVEVYNADDEGRYDPNGKAKVAVPSKPGIYIE
ncbi:MAG: leucine--tRNA ligase [Candidatus Methanomethylophilaceae archaeon]|nr:leucine--tRNA ligase [Candidatus Methanomethylophilaceae archaeon]